MLFDSEIPPHWIIQVSVVLLILSMLLYSIVQTRHTGPAREKKVAEETLSKTGGFTLLFRSHYLLLIARLLLVLNIVNTTGEYILSSKVVEEAEQTSVVDKKAFIGSFYGNYFFVVNIAAFLLQTSAVSRIVKYFGVSGVVLMLPLRSLHNDCY